MQAGAYMATIDGPIQALLDSESIHDSKDTCLIRIRFRFKAYFLWIESIQIPTEKWIDSISIQNRFKI